MFFIITLFIYLFIYNFRFFIALQMLILSAAALQMRLNPRFPFNFFDCLSVLKMRLITLRNLFRQNCKKKR